MLSIWAWFMGVMGVLSLWHGVQNATNPDAVWRRVERNLHLKGMPAERTPDWDAAAGSRAASCYIAGIVMIVIAIVLFSIINASYHSQNQPQTVITIDGHPATPDEQRMILDQMNKQHQ